MNLTSTLSLPPDTVCRTLAILAQKGTGKTYTAMKLTELMLGGGHQVVALDPTGVWWGLRTGCDILIMGGDHGDVPLESTAGEVIAEFVVQSGRSVVLDLSHFESGAAQNRFVTGFAEKLYRLKAHARSPLHLMLDEADSFAPQRPQKGEERMLGAFEAIVRRGRSRGMGLTMISQRPAVLNKNVLTQVDALLCHRITGKQDMDAVLAWVKHYLHTKEQAAEFIQTLPKLDVGQMWFWSPGWMGSFQLGQVLPRTTHDSSATPEPGMERRTVALRAVDLSALTEQIKATVEKVKENDPKELKAEIHRLRSALAIAEAARHQAPPAEPVRIEVPILGGSYAEMKDRLQSLHHDLQGLLAQFAAAEQRVAAWQARPVEIPKAKSGAVETGAIQPRPRITLGPDGNLKLAKAERAILTVLAQHEEQACTKAKVAAISGYAVNGGGFNNAVSRLRTARFIQGSDPISITALGRDALGDFDPLPTGTAAIDHWIRQLPKAEGRILATLLLAPGYQMPKANLADAAGYEASGGGFNNALSNLRTRELITGRDPITLLIP